MSTSAALARRQYDPLTYTDTATGTQQQVTIVRVDDPTALPLSTTLATAYPNDKVIGVDFSGGIGAVVTQLNAALGSHRSAILQSVGAPRCACSTTAAGNKVDVNSLSATATDDVADRRQR